MVVTNCVPLQGSTTFWFKKASRDCCVVVSYSFNPLSLGPWGQPTLVGLSTVSPLDPVRSGPPVNWPGIGQSVEHLFQTLQIGPGE